MPGERVDWQAVLARAEATLRAKPGDRTASRQHAQAIAALGDEERGLALMEDHLARHPDDAWAWDLRCAYLSNGGRLDEAIASADRALAIDPTNGIHRYNRACALALAGLADRAIEDLAEAIASDAELREFARGDESLDGLRDDPRVRALLG